MLVNLTPLESAAEDSVSCRYTHRDALLYALSLGFGETGAANEEPYLERGPGQHTIPTLASALLDHALICRIEALATLHVTERMTLYRPLPPATELLANRRVTTQEPIDGDSSYVEIETELRLARNDTVIATCWRGYTVGDPAGQAAMPAPFKHSPPARDPDLSATTKLRYNQALLFGLLDPMVAAPAPDVGAPATEALPPLLVQGMACRAILETICDYDFTLIETMELRFAGKLLPNATLTTNMWQEGNVVSFGCLDGDGEVIVDNGRCTLRG